MNAYELEEAAFDPACDCAENTVEYIQNYGEVALNVFVPEAVAEEILYRRAIYCDSGNGSKDHFSMVQDALEQIEL